MRIYFGRLGRLVWGQMSLDIWLEFKVDTGGSEPYIITLWERGGISGNLWPMWRRASVGGILYDSDGQKAEDCIFRLEEAIRDMRENPNAYKQLEPSNGWGTFGGALRFLEDFHNACVSHPRATVRVWK